MNDKPIIAFKDFSFQYFSQQEPTLHSINLEIFPGEKILIVGPSGSGKSTLGHCINGLIPFYYKGEISGSLKINNKKTQDQDIFKLSKTIGTVLQDAGEEERTAKTSIPSSSTMALLSCDFCSSSRFNFSAKALTASQFNFTGLSSRFFHSGVALILSVHIAKKATLRAIPFGTDKPACVVLIRLCALPPTSVSSGRSFVLKE